MPLLISPPTRLRSCKSRKCKAVSGFTLMELVMIVFLVGVIAAFAYPYIDSAIDEARYMECEGQLEALRRAKSLYTVDHLGKEVDLAGNTDAIAVFQSYFVTPPTMYCPRVGPGYEYYQPYNLYQVSTCPYCSDPANIPDGVRPFNPQP